MEALWSAALPRLRQRVGERNFSAWIEPIRCESDASGLRLEVPSRFFQDWVTRHFLAAIEQTVAELAGAPCSVRTVVGARATRVPVRTATPRSALTRPRAPRIGRLVAQYTFHAFVVGPTNEVAFRAAQAVAAEPGRRFNPVFLHGGVGLGKTHLVNAIGHDLLRRFARVRMACLSAEAFMNDLITSLRQDQMNAFRERYRRIDALLLDDVQFLAGKERTQEEFFHTFNALYSDGKQIVLTSDKPPAAITGLEDRLRSRFEGGLIADIHPPTREMRIAIVRRKAASQGIDLPDPVVDLLADRSGQSIRELEGALIRIGATGALRGEPITRTLAEQVLGPFVRAHSPVSVETIQDAVCQHFGVSVADLVSHRRDRHVSLPRQIAMYLSRTMAEASFPSIAEKFGGRDHSTVMYAVRTVEERRASDARLAQSLSAIENQLRTP